VHFTHKEQESVDNHPSTLPKTPLNKNNQAISERIRNRDISFRNVELTKNTVKQPDPIAEFGGENSCQAGSRIICLKSRESRRLPSFNAPQRTRLLGYRHLKADRAKSQRKLAGPIHFKQSFIKL